MIGSLRKNCVDVDIEIFADVIAEVVRTLGVCSDTVGGETGFGAVEGQNGQNGPAKWRGASGLRPGEEAEALGRRFCILHFLRLRNCHEPVNPPTIGITHHPRPG